MTNVEIYAGMAIQAVWQTYKERAQHTHRLWTRRTPQVLARRCWDIAEAVQAEGTRRYNKLERKPAEKAHAIELAAKHPKVEAN